MAIKRYTYLSYEQLTEIEGKYLLIDSCNANEIAEKIGKYLYQHLGGAIRTRVCDNIITANSCTSNKRVVVTVNIIEAENDYRTLND